MPYTGIDRTLLFCLLCIVTLGILFVYSSSYYQAMRNGESSTYYLLGHIKRLLMAAIFFFLGLVIPQEKLAKLIFPFLIILVLILILTLIFGRSVFGARRSLAISSFGLQMSEFARIWLVLFLANFFTSHPKTANTGAGLLGAIAICLVIVFLVALQPSVSMAMICLVTLCIMLIYGGVKIKLLLSTFALGSAILIFMVLIFPHVQSRIAGFITHPTYQVQQSLIAIGSGGLLGKGPGAGLQKFLFLPRIHNDFIFAHTAEELGFIGVLIIFIFYWQIYLRGLLIARNTDNGFMRLMVLGLNASIFIIFLIHVGVSIGLLPPTGIPLPFISFGGWSLSANLFAMGIILRASKWRIE